MRDLISSLHNFSRVFFFIRTVRQAIYTTVLRMSRIGSRSYPHRRRNERPRTSCVCLMSGSHWLHGWLHGAVMHMQLITWQGSELHPPSSTMPALRSLPSFNPPISLTTGKFGFYWIRLLNGRWSGQRRFSISSSSFIGILLPFVRQ